MGSANGKKALTQLGFDFGELAVETEATKDEPGRVGFLDSLGMINSLLLRIPDCPRKKQIGELLAQFNDEKGPGTDWEHFNKEIKGLYWRLCFPSEANKEAGLDQLLPVLSMRSQDRINGMLWRMERLEERGELDSKAALRFKALQVRAEQFRWKDSNQTPLWDWHQLLWETEDLFREVTGKFPDSGEDGEESRSFGPEAKQRLVDTLADLRENADRLSPKLLKCLEEAEGDFEALEAAPGTDSMWVFLLDRAISLYEEYSTTACDLKIQSWGAPGEWFVELADDQKVQVTYKPNRRSARSPYTTDGFEYRGEISETGYRSDFAVRDPDIDIVEFSRTRAEEFRAKFKKEFSQSSVISRLRKHLETNEAVFRGWRAKFQAQELVETEIRHQIVGLLMEQCELLRLLREDFGLAGEQLQSLETSMRKRFPGWSINRKT